MLKHHWAKAPYLFFCALILTLPFSTVFGSILEREFQVERNSNGNVVGIYAKSIIRKSNLEMLQKFYGALTNVDKKMSNKKVATKDVVRVIREQIQNPDKTDQQEALSVLSKYLNQKMVFDNLNSDQKEVVEKALRPLSKPKYRLIAKLYDTSYFYRTKLFKELIGGAVDLILGLLPGGQYREIATYLVTRTIDFHRNYVKAQRNRLLYYLTHYSAKDLGVSEKEKRYALSSIYEADIDWYQFWDSIKASKRWGRFGGEKFDKDLKAANKKLSKHKKRYHMTDRWTEFFGQATFLTGPVRKGTEGILNLKTRANPFTSRPSVTLYDKHPHRVFIQRIIYEVAVFAIKFIPVPLLPSALNYYISRMYQGQVLSEGHLLPYLLDQNDFDKHKLVLRQSVNPFIAIGNRRLNKEVHFEELFAH